MVLYFIQKHKKLPHNHTIHTETVQSDKWIGQQPHAHWQLRDTGALSPGGVSLFTLYPLLSTTRSKTLLVHSELAQT